MPKWKRGGNRYRWCVKQLITTFQNTSLKKELLKITRDVEKKSTKGQNFDQSNNQANILEDDLTIIGLGK